MSRRITIPFEGQMVAAEQLSFEPDTEPWTIYKLEDGTVLRIRMILANAARLVDRYKPDGEPIYVLGLGSIPVLDVPAELRQQIAQPESQRE